MMRDLNDLYYYVQAVDHGGFATAGRALGVPKSRLSRRIALLEERLGVRLIQRSPRRFAVTEIGQTYYMHCKAMLVEADAAEEAIALTHAEPCGIVRISCPVALLDARVQIHLEETDRRVDVVGEGIDVAIRVRPPPIKDSDLVMGVLGERSKCLGANPALLQKAGTRKSPADLAELPGLALGLPQYEHVWNLIGPDGAQVAIRHEPRFIAQSPLAASAPSETS